MRPRSAVALLCLTACVGPARTDTSYESKATDTAETVLSAVQTARLTAEAAAKGNITTSYASVLLGGSEDEAGSAQQTFDAVQPPSARSDDLRAELDELLAAASSALSELRIAARRSDLAGVVDRARPLAQLSRRLERFKDAHA